MPKTAGIILVGNEILSGKIEDANAVYLCRELRRLGMDVRKIAVIPDDVDVIAAEVAAAHRAWDVVFTSGGVGPTHDDVTIEGVARALGVAVVRHPELTGLVRQHSGSPRHYPALLLGSYPEFSNPEYRVKVTLESRDPTYLEAALAVFVKGLPADAVVKIT